MARVKDLIAKLMDKLPAESLIYRARYNLLAGNTSGALSDVKSAVACGGNNSSILYDGAGVFFALGRYDEGFSLLRKAVELDPVDLSFLWQLYLWANIFNDAGLMDFCRDSLLKRSQRVPADNPPAIVFHVGDHFRFLSRHFGRVIFKNPVVYTVERDADDYIALCAEFPLLYGSGSTVYEAAAAMEAEIEDLCLDLLSGDNFSQSFLDLKEKVSGMMAQEAVL